MDRAKRRLAATGLQQTRAAWLESFKCDTAASINLIHDGVISQMSQGCRSSCTVSCCARTRSTEARDQGGA
jgi:hypothetical protein